MHVTPAQHSVTPSIPRTWRLSFSLSSCGVAQVPMSVQGRVRPSSNILCVPWQSPCRCLQVSLQGDFEAFLGACTFAGGPLLLMHDALSTAKWQAHSGLAWRNRAAGQQTWHLTACHRSSGPNYCRSSSALLAVYLLIGRKLRSWLPLWVYVLPVTGTGALVLTSVAVPFEHAHLFVMGRAGIFGWLDPQYLPRVAYLAIMPGIVGERAAHRLPSLPRCSRQSSLPHCRGCVKSNCCASIIVIS